jgi:hypothetical protein
MNAQAEHWREEWKAHDRAANNLCVSGYFKCLLGAVLVLAALNDYDGGLPHVLWMAATHFSSAAKLLFGLFLFWLGSYAAREKSETMRYLKVWKSSLERRRWELLNQGVTDQDLDTRFQ